MRGAPAGATVVMMAEATHLRLALAQINPVVGDIDGNVERIRESIERARDGGAQLVVLPELCLSGYPPEDLVLRRDFLDAVREALDRVAEGVEGSPRWSGFRRVERAPEELEHFDPLIDPPPPPPTTRWPCWRRRGPRDLPQVRSRTTGCSTSVATSSRAPTLR